MRLLCLLCSASLMVLAACSELGGARGERGNATISGRIVYPAETTPAMRICALRATDALAICTDSRAGRTDYRLKGLPAGDYQVLAKLSEGDMRVGGHMQPVQCIRAPCPNQLKTVTVAAGADLAGIDLNEFDAAREDFPSIP
jgi:hypothetical protein